MADQTDPLSDYQAVRGSPWLVGRCAAAVVHRLRMYLYRLNFRVLSTPCWLWFLRNLFAFLRKVRPIARLGPMLITTRHADVCEVLLRQPSFNTGEAMTPRMPMGPMVQSIDWPDQHRAERAAIQHALKQVEENQEDYPSLRALVLRRCDRMIPAPGTPLTLNVARDLTEEVALDVATDFFGVGKTCDREILRAILRRLASQIFRAPPPGSEAALQIQQAMNELLRIAREDVERIKTDLAAPPPSAPLLDHFLAREKGPNAPPWLTEDWALRNAASLAVFGTATTARAMTQSIFWLLRLPGAAEAAHEAARAYHSDPTSLRQRKKVLRIVLEGMRFNPMLPILGPRTALRDVHLASGTPGRCPIRAGQTVLPPPLAAMFDPEVFAEPDRFILDREIELDTYLHFGHGPHLCVGKRAAEIQFEEVLTALFRHSNLRLADGPRTRIEYDGPAVERLLVTNA
ncbi:MAG: cytochrome P450 [Pseudomonadota bacterium]